MLLSFTQLSDQAKIWIYQADRQFSAHEGNVLNETLNDFCSQWAAHGQVLHTSFTLLYNQFVILAVDENEMASGCSIDDSVRVMKKLGHQLRIDFFDRTKNAFLIDGKIQLFSKVEIISNFNLGKLSADSIIFNNIISRKGELEKNWKIILEQSWLSKYLSKNSLLT